MQKSDLLPSDGNPVVALVFAGCCFFQVCEVVPLGMSEKKQWILEMMNLGLEFDEFFVTHNLLKVLKSLTHPFE